MAESPVMQLHRSYRQDLGPLGSFGVYTYVVRGSRSHPLVSYSEGNGKMCILLGMANLSLLSGKDNQRTWNPTNSYLQIANLIDKFFLVLGEYFRTGCFQLVSLPAHPM